MTFSLNIQEVTLKGLSNTSFIEKGGLLGYNNRGALAITARAIPWSAPPNT